MPPLDLSKTFCIIEARNQAAEEAFRIPHNAKFLITTDPEEPSSKRLKLAYHHEDKMRLALTLDLDTFNHPKNGLLFGSNERECDIVLDTTNARGISEHHFRLSWQWDGTLHPNILAVCNEASHGTRVASTVLEDEDQLLLNTEGETSVDAGPCYFRFEFPKRTPRQQQVFTSLWKQFALQGPLIKARVVTSREFRFGKATGVPVDAPVRKRLSELGLREIDEIGSGTFASVWKCITPDGALPYAKKKIRLRQDEPQACHESEVRLMTELRHQSLVRCLDSAVNGKYFEIYMDYAKHGCLKTYRYKTGNCRVSEPIAKEITRQVLQGLKYLHKYNVLHRDIKPGNILMYCNDPLDIRIADFGQSRAMEVGSKSLTMQQGTFGYMAPEVLIQEARYWMSGFGPQNYTEKADIFSLGVTLWELLVGSQPWGFIRGTDGARTVYNMIMARQPLDTSPLADKASPEGVALIASMLSVDPADRPGAGDCLNHVWFSQLPIAKGRKDILPAKRRPVVTRRAGDVVTHDTILEISEEDGDPIDVDPVEAAESHVTVPTVLQPPTDDSYDLPHPDRDGFETPTSDYLDSPVYMNMDDFSDEAEETSPKSPVTPPQAARTKDSISQNSKSITSTCTDASDRTVDRVHNLHDPLAVTDSEYYGNLD